MAEHEKEIKDWCEKQELNLNSKQTKSLVTEALWNKQLELLTTAGELMDAIGSEEYTDFNLFRERVEQEWNARKSKLCAAEKNAILQAVSWYDASAEKVVKGTVKLTGDKLSEVLERQGCTEAQLADHGYYPTGKKNEYIEYESESDLRDTENIPLNEHIYAYFVREVKPHVPEAWINMDATKIGYDISFNKYFYRHKPLRSIEEVSADILKLEAESEGLIREILNLD
ncbi:MAG TPA: hypothetical protein VNV35_10350, partial [Puia sp.]|nr:hypothetical protein [Puia sp.]